MTGVRGLFLFCALSAAGLGLTPLVAPARADDATSPEKAALFIEDIGTRAINVLANADASQSNREARVRALLAEGLDLPRIGRFVLGRFGQIASSAQLEDYEALVRDYIIYAYARRLVAYSGETFKVVGAQPIADTDAIVLSLIQRPNGEPTNVGWRVRAEPGGYKVIDVVVEGISMVVTQRQEFASVAQKGGVDGLIAALRDQNRQLVTGSIVDVSGK